LGPVVKTVIAIQIPHITKTHEGEARYEAEVQHLETTNIGTSVNLDKGMMIGTGINGISSANVIGTGIGPWLVLIETRGIGARTGHLNH